MIAAIITAAGKGTRIKSNVVKQFLQLYGKPILAHTLKSFEESRFVDEVYLTVPQDQMDYCQSEIVDRFKFAKVRKLVVGGSVRQESVYNALKAIPEKCKIVTVHDGVRPLITAEEVDILIDDLKKLSRRDRLIKGIIMAAPAYETVKKIGENDIIDCTITRSLVCMAQTPQTFFYNDLLEAYEKAFEDDFLGTDDSSLVERLGWKVKVFMGRHENIKITTPMDLFLAELIMDRDGKLK